MSNRLEEIKNEYAKRYEYSNWTEFINDEPNYKIEHHMNNICELYTKECCKASLEKASEIVYDNFNGSYECKESIVQESNIVIL